MRYFVFLFFLTFLYAEQTIPRLLETRSEVNIEDSQKILPRLLDEKKKEVQVNNIKTVESIKPYKNNFKIYKNDLTRQQMLRQAKYLKQKYLHAMNKLENWEVEKEQKKKSFFRRYSNQDTSFGSDNSYGKKRADRRKREFFKSLAIQEKHIQDRVEDSILKLSEIKEDFLYKFAVPLTEAEINGGTPPPIENRTKRVEMLKNYITENSAWQQCKQKVSEFDRVNRVANSIETLFPEVNLTSQTITTKMEKNKQEMNSHASRFNSIERDYRLEYGVSISNNQRAKIILESITR